MARIGDPADLDLVVTDAPDPVIAGADITYSITAQNLGTADADNTTLTVSISQSTFVSSTGSCAEDTGVVTCDVGTLLAGGGPGPAPAGASSVSFDLVIQVDPYFDGGMVSHTFDLSADPFDLDLSNNSVTVDTTVEFDADLQVTKSDSDDPVMEEDTFDYTVTVTNNGPSGAESVSLTDEIPTEVTFVSSDPDDQGKICFFKGDLGCFFGDLDPGASEIVTITVTAGPGPATATNTATVSSSSTPDSVSANDSVDEDTTILGGADLTVDVSDALDPVVAGTNLTYSVTVMNEGAGEATNSVLDVTLDAGLSFVSASLPPPVGISIQGALLCTPNGNTVSCDLGTIAATGSTIVTIMALVDPGQTTGLSSQFDVSTNLDEQDETDNSETELTTVTTSTDLSITKSDSPDPVITGETLIYMLTATNNGPSDATGVTVTDTLPGGVTYSSSNPSICSLDGDLLCSVGALAAGQSTQFTISVTVDALPGQLSNSATISGSQSDPIGGNDSAVELTTVDPTVDLTVAVGDVPDPVDAGTPLTYNVTVMNTGTGEATNSVLDVTLDAGLSFVSASLPPPVGISIQGALLCTPNGNTVSCDLGTIAAAGSSLVSIETEVDPGQTTALSSQFDVSTALDETNDENNGATANTSVTTSTDLSITKSDSPDPVITGETLIYTLTATNNGPSDATGVTVTDTLPGGVTYSSSNPSICSQNGDLVCNVGALAAEQSTQFTISVTVDAPPGQVSNSATISGSQSDPIGDNDSAVELTTVDPAVDLTVAVGDVPDPVAAGTGLTYNVTVMNTGSGEATNSVLDVTLDAGLSFVSASLPPPVGISIQGALLCTPNGNTVSCDLGTIAAEGSSLVSIETEVDPGQTTALSSQFDVSTELDETNDQNNGATANTSVTTSADLSISKTDSVDPVGTGDTLTYTLTATNSGPSNASEVVVQDTLPEGVILDSSSPSCSLNGDLVCSLGNLSVGQSIQVTATVTVDAVPGTTLTNTASISGAQDDPVGSNNSVVELTEVELTADLEVELSYSPEIPFSGLPMNILATFRNLGPDAAYSGNANILLLGGFTLGPVSSNFSCSPVGNQVLCNFGVFQPNETASASITATPAQGGDFTISGSINSLSTDPVSGNNSDQIMFNIPDDLDLSIVKTSRFDIAASGRLFWYDIEIENLGNGPLTDIQVTDEMTAGLQVNGVTTEDPIDCMESSTSISCVITALSPGEKVSFILEVIGGEGLSGPFVNTVEAAAEGDQDAENNSSTAPAVAAAPGDTNADGAFNAADIVQLLLEIGDEDGEDVSAADGGTFEGNPTMDVDGDGLITLADFDALVALIFPPSGLPEPSGQEPEDQE